MTEFFFKLSIKHKDMKPKASPIAFFGRGGGGGGGCGGMTVQKH